jgi:hypothetical protein
LPARKTPGTVETIGMQQRLIGIFSTGSTNQRWFASLELRMPIREKDHPHDASMERALTEFQQKDVA